MNVLPHIARSLLGLIFLVFGLNGFFNFLPQPPLEDKAMEVIVALHSSGWLPVVKGVEVVAGLLLLANLFPLIGLVLIGPVVFNILVFHLLLAPGGLPMALVLVVLTGATTLSYRSYLGAFVQPRISARCCLLGAKKG